MSTSKTDLEALKQAVQKDKQSRVTACQAEIEDALTKHRCTMTPIMVIQGDKIQSSMALNAKE